MLTCGLVWMNVERCSISTCRVGRSLTKLLWRPIHTPFTRDGCIDRNGKKTCSVSSTCGAIFNRGGGSEAVAATGSFPWETLSTTSGSSLLVDALKFALILIPSRSSVNLKEVKSLFECQP